jgi:hypothetical protein
MMSTFYLLPPRPLLGERFAGFLGQLFPGLSWDAGRWPELADVVGAAVRQPDVYLVHREELGDEDPERALRDGFGAESGDEVVEVRVGPRPGELTARRWRLSA